jgi:Baseplate J-like protein
MTRSTPQLDARTAAEITQQLQALLKAYVPSWQEFNRDAATGLSMPRGASAALIGTFSQFAATIIQRLNQAPEKNFLAFLNLLGAAQLPPQPARVPLTFTLAVGSSAESVVPARTQVAAPPGAGESAPVIFETERELVVTPARLDAAIVVDPSRDRVGDYSAITRSDSVIGAPAFQGNQPIEHSLYIGHSQILRFTEIKTLNLDLMVNQALGAANTLDALRWEFWNGSDWQLILPEPAVARQLSATGQQSLKFSNLKTVPLKMVNGLENRWLRCRLSAPIQPAEMPNIAGMVKADQLPNLQNLSLQATVERQQLSLEQAFVNSQPVDLTKEFYPFGEQPKLGDTLYLANREVFSQANAQIVLSANLMRPGQAAPGGITLKWEFWQGEKWQEFGPSHGFQDSSQAFTTRATDTTTHQVTFKLPPNPVTTTINGVESYWIRARIVAGGYASKEAGFRKIEKKIESQQTGTASTADTAGTAGTTGTTETSFVLEPASTSPPLLESLNLSYTLTLAGPPEIALTCNHCVYDDVTQAQVAFAPFRPVAETLRSLYLGLSLPSTRSHFANRPLSLYVSLTENSYGMALENLTPRESPRLVWQYFNGQDWQRLLIRDETASFTRSGMVEFIPPANFAPQAQFGLPQQFWVRVQLERGEYEIEPKLRQLLLNTTIAVQAVTHSNETLGSSTGNANQIFRTVAAPILADPVLEVRELVGFKDSWQHWQAVPDFYGSTAADRHYLINLLTGEIQFGDGIHGRIPPIGSGNIRMTRYQTGGGAGGNRPAGTIRELKTAIPAIDKATNPIAASGGADAEPLATLQDRIPRTIRHGGRAVTLEDFEDLALLASPALARSKCIPLRNLANHPRDRQINPGEVSVMIVPHSPGPKPLPSLELIQRTQDYLAAHALPTLTLAVVGPLYVQVSVDVEITLTALELASEVEQAIEEGLARFLHPLMGGFDGQGWDFGREPHRSDLYALLEAIPGVDHVHSLAILQTPDRRLDLTISVAEDLSRTKQTGCFLVYSGAHNIRLRLNQ